MATVVNTIDPNKPKDPVEGPVSVSGAASTAVGSGAGQSPGLAPTAAPRASGSGRFTNVQSYLKASQGSGEKIAGRIGEKVGQQTEKLGQAVSTVNQVNPQLQAERDRIAQASGFAQQVNTDASSLANDENKFNAFTQLRTGATGLDPLKAQTSQAFNTADSELGRVQELANMTGSEAGRFELLRQSLGRPSYTRGQQKLDQLLVQSEGGNVLGQLQQNTTGQARAGEQLLGNTKTDLTNQFNTIGNEAKSAQELLMGTLGGYGTKPEEGTGALGTLQQQVAAREKELETARAADLNKARTQLAAGSISPEIAAALGISGNMNTYDVSADKFGQYLTPGQMDITASQAATADQMAKYSALNKLAGLSGPNALNLNADEATLDNALKFDSAGLRAMLDQRGQEVNRMYGNTRVGAQYVLPDVTNSRDAITALLKEKAKTNPALNAVVAKRLQEIARTDSSNPSQTWLEKTYGEGSIDYLKDPSSILASILKAGTGANYLTPEELKGVISTNSIDSFKAEQRKKYGLDNQLVGSAVSK